MSIVYLNGEYMKPEEAKISPMDRGFLYGDGIYEVIPNHHGKSVGLGLHLKRMENGLKEIGIEYNTEQLREVVAHLLEANEGDDLNVYIQISRGTYEKRFHGFPEKVEPTVFLYTWEISEAHVADKEKAHKLKVVTADDLRWQRCHIKSTSLLGNVLHFQQSYGEGLNETLLFNEEGNLTEGSSSNAYIVKDGVLYTPPLSDELLPGITRHILLAILREHSDIEVVERAISKAEVFAADEIWMTSASKEVGPVVEVDGKPVGNGEIGDVWLKAQALYSKYCYDFD
ncbi:D-amino acid aminotransferase [Reinekea marinisedimentorum]|uniref:Aminodeoxychorismate lyase n=1 Tax=Reinekea marinisedimentorum TaxID=230495 RepID=A0A4R3I6L4_9GAMM|nr:D-amino acid aminotransferase [Reinekea marinisedimentorum]TCS40463.1 D-alanine transaminase [Reinekea marinisedimentorum]